MNESPEKVKCLGDNNMDDEVSDGFKDSLEEGLIIHCNIVSFFPNEYGFASEAYGDEEEDMCVESAGQKHLCYYVINNGGGRRATCNILETYSWHDVSSQTSVQKG